MATQDWVLYDTQDFGTVASVVHTYFQNREGSGSSFTKFVTNMRGDGNLPQQEEFVVHNIAVFPDDDFATADLQDMLIDSYLQFSLSDKQVLQAPLRACIAFSAYGGHYSQTTGADENLIGLAGSGYMLRTPIVVEGGVNFRVEVGQGKALSAASMGVKVALVGMLTTPS